MMICAIRFDEVYIARKVAQSLTASDGVRQGVGLGALLFPFCKDQNGHVLATSCGVLYCVDDESVCARKHIM